ncbi:linker nucleoporin NIC96 [Ascoidea rubescens DSM 1968]|uniref:Nuclear pore protein n=1 Tax=Ascoidea rubescens DSM 1968 TaxID=1344418 RepID=A0A1D2VRD7_9ASCO|nr:NIC-domain-containing protein [Ascoidea rubescens DSM 1968]ODV64135.1 NIC-domain-containing protein [Ascoidea rubescens DSM 1968]
MTNISLSAANNGSRLLQELLESSKNLPTQSSEFDSIQLGVNEIKKRAHNLRRNKDKNPNYTKAHYLLAGSGASIDYIESELKSIESQLPQYLDSSNLPVISNDFDAYLDSKKDECILAAIERSLALAAKDYDNYVNQNISIDWKSKRDDVIKSFGISLPNNNNTNSNSNTTGTNILNEVDENANANTNDDANDTNSLQYKKLKKGDSSSLWKKKSNHLNNVLSTADFQDLTPLNPKLINVNDFSSRDKFEKNALYIYQFNNFRQSNKNYPLANCFMDITSAATDAKSKQINEVWKILNNFIKVNNITDNINLSNDNNYINNTISFRKKLLLSSKKYLESQFFDHVNNIFNKNLQINSNENGLPTNINKIKSFLNSQHIKKNLKNINITLINDVPIWPLIFYLLRAGCYTDALEVLESNKSVFKKIDQNFLTYFRKFVSLNNENKKLSKDLENKIQIEFNQFIRNSIDVDPYKYAVYKIIGRCDLTKKNIPRITIGIEDWLWLHLTYINEDNNDLVNDPVYQRYTLADLQKTIIQSGAGHFNTVNNPLYLQTLVLTGLYELAVQQAYTINEIDAVHLAIGFAYYALLRFSSNQGSSNLLITKNSQKQTEINFSRLLGYYTRSFRFSETRASVEYLLLICLRKDKHQIEIAHEALRELVLETREFSMLLGDINSDGTALPGRIEERKELLYLQNEKEYLDKIAEKAAIKADEEGRIYDSLLLYQLSEKHDTVISIVNKLLADLLSNIDIYTSLNDQALKENGEAQPIDIARNLSEIYKLSPEKISTKNRNILDMLLGILDIRQNFIENKWKLCLKLIEDLNIFPLNCSNNNDLNYARKKAQEFNELDENIAKNISNLLLITMTCVSEFIYQLSNSSYIDPAKEAKLFELNEMSKNCMIYAGMVQYKMPRETYSKLISLESINM